MMGLVAFFAHQLFGFFDYPNGCYRNHCLSTLICKDWSPDQGKASPVGGGRLLKIAL
jgi:hypothetical protein